MLKKNTIVSAIISIILSIFAVIFNVIIFYIFLIVGAFSSLGSNNLLIIDVIITMTCILFILSIILFVISIIIIFKTKKAIEYLVTKKLLIFYIILIAFIAIINIIMGILVINSIIGWLYILFGLMSIVSILLVVREIVKNSKLVLSDENSNN